ncbi:MAG: VanW family protein [Christensenellaceae bacterium]|jgi:vancomycin resistance protein YoaR|nr:VanW family protein [Christensenellaceae bacterium]
METETKTAQNRKKKKKKAKASPLKVVLIVLTCLLVGVGGTFGYFYFNGQYKENLRSVIIEADTFREGVTINGVDLANKTLEEARSAMAAVEKDIRNGIQFNFLCDGKQYLADSTYFDITFNTESVLTEAMALARAGELDALQDELEDIKTNGREYTIEYTALPTRVEAFIHSFADTLTTEPVPAFVAVKPLEVNSDTKVQNAVNIALPEGVTDKRDLFFDFTAAVEGYGVDIEGLLATVATRAANQDFGDVTAAMTNIPADVTIDTLRDSLVLRGRAFTSFKSTRGNSNRVFNLKKACGLVYGTVLQPEEVFSANTALGDRTERLGWKMAPAVIGGGSATEDQPGGGVCQISTTMYNAVLKGDLEVTYRRNHSSRSGYIDGGLDATINTGTIDFNWKNNTEHPVYVFCWVDTSDYTVVCEIYGDPFPDTFDTIELRSELVETLPSGPVEYQVLSSLSSPFWAKAKAAKDGYVYKSFATYKKNGAEVETREIATSKYNAHALTYYVWPGFMSDSPLQDAYELTLDAGSNQYVLKNPVLSDAEVQ